MEVVVRPRKGSAAICSRCHLPGSSYDQLAERRFEFIPLWGFFVFLLCTMRRAGCRRCRAVVVEEIPWARICSNTLKTFWPWNFSETQIKR